MDWREAFFALAEEKANETTPASQWEIGKFYFIRGVTMYYVGRVVTVDSQFLILDQCAWVADTGRFSEALKTGKLTEVEPFPDGPVKIGLGTICDASLWHGEAQRIVR